jgi:hypothetical protein
MYPPQRLVGNASLLRCEVSIVVIIMTLLYGSILEELAASIFRLTHFCSEESDSKYLQEC